MLECDAATRARALRNLSGFRRRAAAGGRRAAVGVVLGPGPDGRLSFVLTRRSQQVRAHRGQWALPGGRSEQGESEVETALRETHEEVGLRLAPDAVLGLLDDYATRSGFVITPVVAWHQEATPLTLDPREVAAAYRVPVDDLGAPRVPQLRRIPESDRPIISVPLSAIDTIVHAPTAAILYQLWEVAFAGRETRVSHFEQPVFAWE